MDSYVEGFPIYKGLQLPLEFMGIRGRFLMWAAGAFAMSFATFIACYLLIGGLVAFLSMLVVAGCCAAVIFFKQKKGLHSKKICRDIVVYNNLFSR